MPRKELITEEDLKEMNLMEVNEIEEKDFDAVAEFDSKFDGSFNPLLMPKIADKNARPWQYHKQLLNEVPDFDTTIEFIRQLASKKLYYGAIISIMYLSGSRVGEILGNVFEDGTVWEGIRWGDLDYNDKGEIPILKIRTITEKRLENKDILKRGIKYKFLWKTISIPQTDDYLPLIDIIIKYAETQEVKEDKLMFNISYNSIRKYIRENYQISMHSIRHWRSTHLAQLHHLSESELRDVLGWEKNSAMPTNYVHASGKVITNKLKTIDRY